MFLFFEHLQSGITLKGSLELHCDSYISMTPISSPHPDLLKVGVW